MQHCPSCSATNPAGKHFCGDCGSPLPASIGEGKATPEQRRPLTVLFCDLVGFTELSRRTDPEELAEILGRFQSICARAVKACEGHIAQFLGDGVLVYFGFPRAHEDDARRALDCGLAILSELAESRRSASTPSPQVRIGAHTGRVFISALRAGGHREVLALGDVPNVASRITDEAEPDSLWVSDTTWRLADGWFEGADKGPRQVRGVDEEMRLWRILRRTPATTRLDAMRVHTPYVGRRRELDEIRALRERVRLQDRPAALTVLGEPGMGKSRLFEQFLRPDGESGATRAMRLRCVETMSATAFHPLVDRLGEILAADAGSSGGGSDPLERLASRCAALGLHDPDVVPLIASLLGIASPTPSPSLAGLSPGKRRRRTMEVLVAALVALVRAEGPLLLVVEDLHWADASTLSWLQMVLRSVDDAPLLLLGSARPEFVPPWRGLARAAELVLPRLDATESMEMVRGVAGGKSLPAAVMHALVLRCDGVPLYLEEATRAVLASGLLREEEFTWEAIGEALAVEIPSSVDAALAARFDGLGAARTSLDLAATIGREVSVPLLEAVSDESPRMLAAHLDAMVAAGLLRPLTGSAAGRRVGFKHALIRDAAYEAIPRRRRIALHARIAAALRSRFPEWAETQPELFALHLSGSGDSRAAVEFLRAAAARALHAGALDEATAHLEHAVRLLHALPPDEGTLRAELAIQVSLAGLYNARTWTDQATDRVCDRILELSRQLGDTPSRHFACWGKWAACWARGRIPESTAAAITMREALADANPAPFMPLAAPYASALTALEAGDIADAVTLSEVPAGIDVAGIDRFVAANVQLSPWTGILVTRYCCHYITGHFSRAAAVWQDVERVTAELAPTPIAQGFATSFGLTLRFACGSLPDWAERDPADLDARLDGLIRLCHEEGLGMWLSFAVLVQAALDCQRQRLPGLRQRVAEHIRLLDAAGVRLWFVHFLALYGWLCHLDGDPSKALSLLDDAKAEAQRSGQQLGVWDVHRLRARVLADTGNARQAFDSLVDASAAAARLGSPTFMLRCALDRHALAGATGHADDALAALRHAFDAMPEPDADVPDANRARAVLSGASAARLEEQDLRRGLLRSRSSSGHGSG